MQSDHAYDLAANDCDKSILALSAFGQKFSYRFETAVRQLQGVADDQRGGVAPPYGFRVRRLSFANVDVHDLKPEYELLTFSMALNTCAQTAAQRRGEFSMALMVFEK
jgi:hypothetical protein